MTYKYAVLRVKDLLRDNWDPTSTMHHVIDRQTVLAMRYLIKLPDAERVLAQYHDTVERVECETRKDCAEAIEATISKAEQGVKWRRLAASLRDEDR